MFIILREYETDLFDTNMACFKCFWISHVTVSIGELHTVAVVEVCSGSTCTLDKHTHTHTESGSSSKTSEEAAAGTVNREERR